MSKDKQRRKRRQFSPEFKADAVQLYLAGDRSIAQVAKDLDLTETALRSWVRKAQEDGAESPSGALTSAEREELRELRRENRELRRDREILKKAAAFFAKEPK